MHHPIIVHTATHPSTGLSVLAYEAPTPTAFMLTRAEEVLSRLHGRSLPGLPVVLQKDQQKDGRVRLMVEKPPGNPLLDHLLAGATWSEPELLDLMKTQLQILEAIHELGFSGWRPTWSDIWWDAPTARWTLLGWEWLVEGTNAALEDLRAAAAVWIELVQGAPPGPALSLNGGARTWQALSTGLRHLIMRLWQARRPMMHAGQARQQVIAWDKAWHEETPDKVLAEAHRILRADPLQALSLFEIARQRGMDLTDEDTRAYALAQTLISEHVNNLLDQGRQDFRLGAYESAQYAFQRAANWPHLPPEQLEFSACWLLLAERFHQGAAELQTPRPALRELENEIDEVMNLAANGRLETARKRLISIRESVQTQADLKYGLEVLDALFHARLLWKQAIEMETMGKFEDALTYLRDGEKVVARHSPAHPRLFQVLQEDIQTALVRMEPWERMEKSEKDAWHEVKMRHYRLAAALLRQAAQEGVDWPQERARLWQDAFHFDLWSQLNEHPTPPSFTPWPRAWMDEAVAQIQICEDILQHFPGDGDRIETIKQAWRKVLLQADPAHGETVLWALGLLERHWERDQAMRGLVTRTVNRQIEAGQQLLEALSSAPPRTPAEHQQAIARCEAILSVLRRLQAFSPPKKYQLPESIQACDHKRAALTDRLERIRTLRIHYEQLRQGGGPALPVLEEAQRLRLELFDAPEAAVARLIALEKVDMEQTRRTLQLILQRLAATALEAQQPHIARAIYQLLQTPYQESRFLEASLKFGTDIAEAISTQ